MLRLVLSRALVCAGLAIPSGLLVGLYDEAFISNDGCQYVSVARNLSTGKGLSTSIVYYEEHYRLGGVPVPQTVFPPGYPVLIAAITPFGISGALSAFLISLGSFALSAFVLYDLARTRGHGLSGAGLLSGIWVLSVAGWTCVLGCTAEMAFILLTLVSLRCLGDDGEGERPLLAGVAAAAAVTIRYAGVFYLAALALVLGMELARHWGRIRLRRFALVVGPPLIVLAALFLRNLLLVGDFKGVNDLPPDRTLLELPRSFYWALSGLLGFSRSGLVGFRPPEILLVACLISVAALLIATRGLSLDRAAGTWLRGRVVLVSVCYIGLTLALLAYLELTTPLGLSTRFLLPPWPFVLLLAPEAVAKLRAKLPPPVLLQRVTLGLMAAAFVAGQAVLLEDLAFGPRVRRNRSLRVSFARGELTERLAEEGRAGRPVLANQVQQVGGILQQPVLGLAEPEYTARVWTADAVRALARAYGVRYVVFHPATFINSGNQVFFRELAAGHIPEWLEIETLTSDFGLYRLAPSTEGEAGGPPR